MSSTILRLGFILGSYQARRLKSMLLQSSTICVQINTEHINITYPSRLKMGKHFYGRPVVSFVRNQSIYHPTFYPTEKHNCDYRISILWMHLTRLIVIGLSKKKYLIRKINAQNGQFVKAGI